ncbi:hypothetical protein [Phyllobacterium sp. K27]
MPKNMIIEEPQVASFLNGLRLPKSVLLEILSKTAGETANVNKNDPATVRGFESWRWGTRFCRENEILRSKGWVACDHKQIDGIRNDDLRVKLVICNMSANAGNPNPTKEPRNVNKKGAGNCFLIGGNSAQLTMGFPLDQPVNPIELYDFWYFGIHVTESQVSAEICRADSEIGGFITSLSDRVIIARPGELPGLGAYVPITEDFAEVPSPSVKRKQK